MREFDHFTDHSITRYVEYIQRAVEEEESVDDEILVVPPAERAAGAAHERDRCGERHSSHASPTQRRDGEPFLSLSFFFFFSRSGAPLDFGDGFEHGRRDRDGRRQSTGGCGRAGRRGVEQFRLAAMDAVAVVDVRPARSCRRPAAPARGDCRRDRRG